MRRTRGTTPELLAAARRLFSCGTGGATPTLFVLVLAMTSLLWWRTDLLSADHPWFQHPWDHHKYIFMATHGLLELRVAPFCWRIGLPALVKMLPLPVEAAFMLVAILSVAGAAWMCARLGRALDLPRPTQSFLALSFLATGWAAKGPLASFYGTDALALFLLCTGLCLILERRWIALTVLLCVSVCVKESLLVLAPLAYTLVTPRLLARRDLARAILVASPALVVLAVIRWLAPALNSQPEYLAGLPESLRSVHGGAATWHLGELLSWVPRQRLAELSLPDLGRCTFYPFGLTLLALAGVGAWSCRALALRLLPLVVLAYAQLLVAVNTERLLVLAVPAVLVLAAVGLRQLLRAGEAEESPLWWTLPLALYSVLLISPPSHGQNLGLHLAQLAASMAAAGVSRRGLDRRARPSPATDVPLRPAA